MLLMVDGFWFAHGQKQPLARLMSEHFSNGVMQAALRFMEECCCHSSLGESNLSKHCFIINLSSSTTSQCDS